MSNYNKKYEGKTLPEYPRVKHSPSTENAFILRKDAAEAFFVKKCHTASDAIQRFERRKQKGKVMTNFEKMKQMLISRIEQMSVTQFENLCLILNGARDNYDFDEPIDVTGLFSCVDCEEKYGSNCGVSENPEICSERFAKFASEPAE